MRLFLGIPLADSSAATLLRLTTRLRASAPGLRWSAPDSWHITLQFLGNTSPTQYDCLLVRLAGLHAPPVSIQFAGFGLFARTGILHLGIERTPQLLALQQSVVTATTPCGFAPESRPYHPHITLARFKVGKGRRGENGKRAPASHNLGLHGLDLHSLAAKIQDPALTPELPRFTAREFLLFESHLSSSGSTYEIRHRFSLGASLAEP
jgi:RNA 2',3'-cyclic 3'-phosphodiesterase